MNTAAYIAAALAAPHGAERAKVIAEALEWNDTPWRHENREKGKGVDCGNYPAGVFANAGMIAAPPLYCYGRHFYLRGEEVFRGYVANFCTEVGHREYDQFGGGAIRPRGPLIGEQKPLPGDILGFAVGRVTVGHVAIFLSGEDFIHSYNGRAYQKVELGDLREASFARALSGIWRLTRWC